MMSLYARLLQLLTVTFADRCDDADLVLDLIHLNDLVGTMPTTDLAREWLALAPRMRRHVWYVRHADRRVDALTDWARNTLHDRYCADCADVRQAMEVTA